VYSTQPRNNVESAPAIVISGRPTILYRATADEL
jgi:hypothetical protein